MDANNVIVVSRSGISSETENYEKHPAKFDDNVSLEEGNKILDDGSDIEQINGSLEGSLKLNNRSVAHDDEEIMVHEDIHSFSESEVLSFCKNNLV